MLLVRNVRVLHGSHLGEGAVVTVRVEMALSRGTVHGNEDVSRGCVLVLSMPELDMMSPDITRQTEKAVVNVWREGRQSDDVSRG